MIRQFLGGGSFGAQNPMEIFHMFVYSVVPSSKLRNRQSAQGSWAPGDSSVLGDSCALLTGPLGLA